MLASTKLFLGLFFSICCRTGINIGEFIFGYNIIVTVHHIFHCSIQIVIIAPVIQGWCWALSQQKLIFCSLLLAVVAIATDVNNLCRYCLDISWLVIVHIILRWWFIRQCKQWRWTTTSSQISYMTCVGASTLLHIDHSFSFLRISGEILVGAVEVVEWIDNNTSTCSLTTIIN